MCWSVVRPAIRTEEAKTAIYCCLPEPLQLGIALPPTSHPHPSPTHPNPHPPSRPPDAATLGSFLAVHQRQSLSGSSRS